jgi:hypothetical protein
MLNTKQRIAVVAALVLASTAAIVPSTTFARDKEGGDGGDGRYQGGSNQDDHDWDGHDWDRHDRISHDRDGHHRDDHDRDDHDRDDHDRDDHDRDGHDRDGHDRDGKYQGGHGDPSTVSLPEPATLGLLVLGGTAVAIVRRRKRPS